MYIYMMRSLKKILKCPEKFNSYLETIGFTVVTPKGIIGKVTDFIFNESSNELEYLIVDTEDIFPEQNLLVHTGHIRTIDRLKAWLYLSITIDDILGE